MGSFDASLLELGMRGCLDGRGGRWKRRYRINHGLGGTLI